MPLNPGQVLNNPYHIVRMMRLELLLLIVLIAVSNLLVGCLPGKRAATQITPSNTRLVTPFTLSTVTPITTTTPTVTPTPTLTLVPSITATSIFGIGSTQISMVDGMVMMYIPASDFLMGSMDSDPNARNNEEPQHTIYLNAFWMYRTEVTNAMYANCVKAGVCRAPLQNYSFSRSSYYIDSQYSNFPVIFVSWNDALDYCGWAGGRLPTEAEWEKAARGGLKGKLYPWGDDAPICDRQAKNGANFNNCMGDTTSAGYFLPNDYGLYDMASNVWEWVADRYDGQYYSNNSPDAWPTNPLGPLSGDERVERGGCWLFDSNFLRVSYRSWSPPEGRSVDLGFRCVRSP